MTVINQSDDNILHNNVKRQVRYDEENWMKLYIAGVEEFFALEPSGLEIKIFLALSMFITYGNRIAATQAAIGKKIGLERQNVNEAFKGLLAKHVIYELA